jgi:phosphatidylserine/phosphatidylglycerophosphate/cardiolipin synthase-like enzyme
MADLFRPTETCWRVERATRATVIIDADDYFRAAREAMLKAKKQILLIGWDFDARINLTPGRDPGDGAPATVGAFISWLVERTPELEVHLLRWDVGALKTLFRGRTIFTIAAWMMKRSIHTKLDGHHPTGGSHHQKIVVIDDCLAFCGGIDMTAERWDTRDHADDDPRRIDPGGRAYGPWHDATTALEGPVAKALGELSRERWKIAGGKSIAAPHGEGDCWPDSLTPDFTDVDVAIARTVPEMDEQEGIHEIETLYLSLIASAKRTIYAESQYFASRRIAEAIARRLDEADGPEIVVVNPKAAHGWLEPLAMDTARARLFQAVKRRDLNDRLRLYHPYTAGGTPIYVHAKILVVDDAVIRIGSSNFNNRSLRLDTECDVAIHAEDDRTSNCIAAIRNGLIAEHLGVEPDAVAAEIKTRGSLIAAIDALRKPGRTLRDYEVPDLNKVEKWLAENEVLDPESPEDMFEATTGGLLRGLVRRVRRSRG